MVRSFRAIPPFFFVSIQLGTDVVCLGRHMASWITSYPNLLVPPVRVELTIHRLKGECDAGFTTEAFVRTSPAFSSRFHVSPFHPRGLSVNRTQRVAMTSRLQRPLSPRTQPRKLRKRRRPPRNLFRAAFASSNYLPNDASSRPPDSSRAWRRLSRLGNRRGCSDPARRRPPGSHDPSVKSTFAVPVSRDRR